MRWLAQNEKQHSRRTFDEAAVVEVVVEEEEDVEDVDPFLPPDPASSNGMVLKQFLYKEQ